MIDEKLSVPKLFIGGVIQDSVLGDLVFPKYIRGNSFVQDGINLIFADGIDLFYSVYSFEIRSFVCSIHCDLKALGEWCHSWEMQF